MRSTNSLLIGTRVIRFSIGLAASCGMTIALNGAALAASGDQDATAQTATNQTTVVAKSDTSANAAQISSLQVVVKSDTTQSGTADKAVTPSGSGQPAVAASVATQQPSALAESSSPAAPVATPADPAGPTAASQVDTFLTATGPAAAPVRSQLVPSRTGWVMLSPLSQDVTAAQPEITEAIATAAASLPPVNTPVQSSGLFGQLPAGLAGVIAPSSLLGFAVPVSDANAIILLTILSVLLITLAGQTYGAWLRRVGHVTAARSDLLSSFFATPLLMDFIPVSPPERGPFFGVADTNTRIINQVTKGAKR